MKKETRCLFGSCVAPLLVVDPIDRVYGFKQFSNGDALEAFQRECERMGYEYERGGTVGFLEAIGWIDRKKLEVANARPGFRFDPRYSFIDA